MIAENRNKEANGAMVTSPPARKQAPDAMIEATNPRRTRAELSRTILTIRKSMYFILAFSLSFLSPMIHKSATPFNEKLEKIKNIFLDFLGSSKSRNSLAGVALAY